MGKGIIYLSQKEITIQIYMYKLVETSKNRQINFNKNTLTEK